MGDSFEPNKSYGRKKITARRPTATAGGSEYSPQEGTLGPDIIGLTAKKSF
jgi:hypothetical protein